MTERLMYERKLVYLVAIVVLIVPIYMLSSPASRQDMEAGKASTLVAMRHEHGLAQSNLGDIDPTSETIKLATLGMRGVAANILWNKANEYKKKEDWANMMATVDVIVRLQPHFISVWRFQAWNVAYNVSVEWDDVRDRYFWVIRGVTFLHNGVAYNKREPTLPWDEGWIISQKMGKSDERKYFRPLFVQDDDFHNKYHPNFTPEQRDSWLVGKYYYYRAQEVLAQRKEFQRGEDIKGINSITFFAEPPLNQMYYAAALVKEGIFDQRSRLAWIRAYREWAGDRPEDKSYGQHPLKTPIGPVRLNDAEKFEAELLKLLVKLEELAPPGLRDELLNPRLKDLDPEWVAAWKMDPRQRNNRQQFLAAQADFVLSLDPIQFAQAMPAAVRPQAMKLAQQAHRLRENIHWIHQRREIVNFVYWRTRAEAEQTRNALTAHQAFFEAAEAAPKAHFEKAQDAYEEGMEHWRLVLEEFPYLMNDQITAEEMIEEVRKYQRVLGHLDEKFPILGYGLVALDEVKSWPKFCELLVAASADPEAHSPAARIWRIWGEPENRSWGEPAREAARRAAKSESPATADLNEVQFAFNAALKWTRLYDPADFPSVEIPEPLLTQLTADLTELPRREVRIRNRRLAELVFADHLNPAPNVFVLRTLFELQRENALARDVLIPLDLGSSSETPKQETKPDVESEAPPATKAPEKTEPTTKEPEATSKPAKSEPAKTD